MEEKRKTEGKRKGREPREQEGLRVKIMGKMASRVGHFGVVSLPLQPRLARKVYTSV
jgi:hypothetical protein